MLLVMPETLPWLCTLVTRRYTEGKRVVRVEGISTVIKESKKVTILLNSNSLLIM